MIKQILASSLVAFGVLGVPQGAFAHAMLKSARPAVGSTVAGSPRTIELDFSEGVVPKFSGLSVRDGKGKPVAVGKPSSAGEATLVVPVSGTLAAGEYTVTWHAVSVDSHRTQGSFRFTVAP